MLLATSVPFYSKNKKLFQNPLPQPPAAFILLTRPVSYMWPPCSCKEGLEGEELDCISFLDNGNMQKGRRWRSILIWPANGIRHGTLLSLPCSTWSWNSCQSRCPALPLLLQQGGALDSCESKNRKWLAMIPPV